MPRQPIDATHALCQADFGRDSLMCTGEKFWLSPNAEAPMILNYWLRRIPDEGWPQELIAEVGLQVRATLERRLRLMVSQVCLNSTLHDR